jgi:hypothetical protein
MARASERLVAQPDPAPHMRILMRTLVVMEWPHRAVLAAFGGLTAASLVEDAVFIVGRTASLVIAEARRDAVGAEVFAQLKAKQ